ncbi:MAG: Eco57I restriction-modification methylase domain-containing protein [Pirellulaceae bacterium]|nr:Eco57I restriction-modification methylase domain-containing protein [Pirellulaceae bacterium]
MQTREGKRRLLERLARTRTNDERVACARAAVKSLVERYWQESCRRVGVTREIRQCDLLLPTPADGVGDASTIGTATADQHQAAYEISSLYAAMLPEDLRARYGVYFTPPALVDRLLHLASQAGCNWEHARVIDPACGGGAFLAPVASRMAAQLRERRYRTTDIRASIIERLRGVEIDPFLAWMAQVFVDAALLELAVGMPDETPPLVVTADALTLSSSRLDSSFDLVIGNPPYGKTRLTPDLRDQFAESLYGHANMYGIFTELATRLVASDGIIAYVTPTSFLGGQYFQNLRRCLIERAPPHAIDFITERSGVFEDVLQETLLAVFRPRKKGKRVQVHFLKPIPDGNAYQVTKIGSFECNGGSGAPWILPREPGQVTLLRKLEHLPWRLADYGYSVSTGPLVWNRHKEQLTDRPGKDCYPLIWAESVRANGEFSFRYGRRNHSPYFKVRAGQRHLLTRQPCVLVQRTTAKEQNRRLIVAFVPDSFLAEHQAMVVENHLNMIRPFQAGRTLFGPAPIGLPTVAAILNSSVADQIFRCISGSVAVSAYELESLALPAPEVAQEIDCAIRNGKASQEIEGLISQAYGIRL